MISQIELDYYNLKTENTKSLELRKETFYTQPFKEIKSDIETLNKINEFLEKTNC